MGRSRIVQVDNEAIDPKDFLSEKDCKANTSGEYSFVGTIAEYVLPENSKEEGLACFFRMLDMRFEEFVKIDQDSLTFSFLSGFKDQYFEHKKIAFLKMSEQLRSGELDFSDSMFAYDALRIVNDNKSVYIYIQGTFETLDEFVRNATPDKTYYIGHSLRYEL